VAGFLGLNSMAQNIVNRYLFFITIGLGIQASPVQKNNTYKIIKAMTEIKVANLAISSPAFKNEENIPSRYTCDGAEINPSLNIGQAPEGTRTLALIMEDPDAPGGTFDHWLVWNIPVSKDIKENSIPGITGVNSTGKTGYHGPCPPSGSHRYYFYVFALDSSLDIKAGANKKTLQQAMKSHILAKGTLMGRYQRSK
jgi:Raf kinase inhibitor-like YbhB/YbcL family protein